MRSTNLVFFLARPVGRHERYRKYLTKHYREIKLYYYKYFQKVAGEKSPIGFLIYTGEIEQKIGNIHVVNYKNLHKMMALINPST